jgi:flagellar basal-body rod protein FlgB
MSTQDLTLTSALLRKMDWLEERQKVIAQNVANADTPGYRPMDIKELDFKDLLGGSTSKLSLSIGVGSGLGGKLALTAPDGEAASASAISSSAGQEKTPASRQKSTYEVAPAGNAVILEEQLLKMNANYTDHAFVSNLYQRNINLLKTAVK